MDKRTDTDKSTTRIVKDPCCDLDKIPAYKLPDPSSFERWDDLRRLAKN